LDRDVLKLGSSDRNVVKLPEDRNAVKLLADRNVVKLEVDRDVLKLESSDQNVPKLPLVQDNLTREVVQAVQDDVKLAVDRDLPYN
jgi:hypothetical protein